MKIVALANYKLKNDIPNAILFYGPTGCGKTLFANAAAEQCLFNVHIIHPKATDSYQEVFDEIINTAKEIENDYYHGNKRRGAIIINEAEWLLDKDSPILEEFKEFAKSCSQQYYCTLFLTTNSPSVIDKSILSKDITPFKIAIPQADRETAKAIIDNTIKILDRDEVDSDKMVDLLFKESDKYYTNAQIRQWIDFTSMYSENPSLEDYLSTFEVLNMTPALRQKDIDEFNNEKSYLNSL